MNRRQRKETEALISLINHHRSAAVVWGYQLPRPREYRYHTDKARQYLFDLIRLTRYKSAIEPVNEAY